MNILINNQQSATCPERSRRIGNRQFARGFSLTEVLLAVGILAVGMMFIAGVFPVSVYFTTVATERSIAPIVADEAFAKIKLYGSIGINTVPGTEFSYPSTPTADPNSKQYWWSGTYQPVLGSLNDFIVTVFVSRKVGVASQYWVRTSKDNSILMIISHPMPVYVGVSASPSGRADELAIGNLDPAVNETSFINDGYTIADDATGNIYRVLERYPANPNVIHLDKDWIGPLSPNLVWVVPPPIGGGRYPCIGVYQKVMRF